MNSLTPANTIKTKDLEANTEALNSLLTFLPQQIQTVLDIRYGLGGWFKAVRAKFPLAKIEGYELDLETFQQASKDKKVKLHNKAYPKKSRKQVVDLLLADFNTCTMLKRKELDEALESIDCRYLVFTDVCSSKLHLNYKSYGLKSPSLDSYWKRFKVSGYELIAWEKKHYAASTALYTKKKLKPSKMF